MKKCVYYRALALLGALIVQLTIKTFSCHAANALPMSKSIEVLESNLNISVDLNSTIRSDDLIKSSREMSSIYEIFLENKIKVSVKRSLKSGKKIVKPKRNGVKNSTLERNERSANLSHISGSARKIQLYIKNRFLQLMPDGVVNGTTDDNSDYSILQRTTVNVGQIKMQGVASCLFLCMDQCGVVYGSIDFTDDCIFNESIEQHHYNTYSSTYNSNAKRTFYLGLNRHGQPRKIQIPTSRQLGKLSTYTKSLTQTVAQERVDQLIARLYGKNHLRHGLKQLCESEKPSHNQDIRRRKDKLKCKNAKNSNKVNNKRKKKKRKCRADETENGQCMINQVNNESLNTSRNINNNNTSNNNSDNNKKKKAPNVHKKNNNCNNNSREDCNNNRKSAKKGAKKDAKVNTESISNSKVNSKGKSLSSNQTLIKLNEFEHDPLDMLSESEELNNEDNYEYTIPGNTANFIDESDLEEN